MPIERSKKNPGPPPPETPEGKIFDEFVVFVAEQIDGLKQSAGKPAPNIGELVETAIERIIGQNQTPETPKRP